PVLAKIILKPTLIWELLKVSIPLEELVKSHCRMDIHVPLPCISSSSPQTPLVSLVPNKKVASERPEEADSTNFDPCEQCSVDFRITLLMLLLQDF
ncbi:hypothetical protein YQE_12939, partial [Dendroctonus ponderosae]